MANPEVIELKKRYTPTASETVTEQQTEREVEENTESEHGG